MKYLKLGILLGICLLVLRGCLSFTFFFQSTIDCTVVKVKDGDTVVLKTDKGKEITVRIIDINTPETGTPTGDLATYVAKRLLPVGTPVILRYHGLSIHAPYMDKYHRVLGYVFYEFNGVWKDYSTTMMSRGLADWY